MDIDPYKAPDAEVVDNSDAEKVEFYVVSVNKFVALYIATMGLYGVYWFYKNWQLYKVKYDDSSWPIARGIFNIFFTHSLFALVQDTLDRKKFDFEWKPKVIATLYVLLALTTNVLDRLATKEIGSPYTDMFAILTLPLTCWLLTKAQRAINLSQNDPEGRLNAHFTTANIIWLILGAIFWLFVLLGMAILFNPEILE